MNRWLISLFLILSCWIFPGSVKFTEASPVEVTELSSQQIAQGEKIAKKAVRAAEKGNFAIAEIYWTELVEKFPDNPAVWSNRGNVRIGQYKLTEAIADFDRSIEIAPLYPDAYLNRGIAYEGKKQWDQAIADYNRVLKITPQDPVALNNRGNAKAGQENWQDALTDYQQAADLAPTFPLARGNASLVMYQMGDLSEAIRNMRNLVRKYPMYSDMRAALAAALWVEGQQGEAESNWVAAVGLDSRYQDLDWIANIRRWPPKMVDALEKFLNLT
ncbi:tetratricopeptide repeat protein [Waterburya agarophytonicola K14]|uniref:Tetratricopeptide repeat protein n=1 Tax=Waterburya agarophytonicola KI4 TaxID=2874699 RepID=A0A964FGB5_9CYAN|nr:tetratricopeptide repeat protein [Waterburya agarophytonicola]MCC0176353.1 tetratricopeptide repeat protein [Waterburya agarophytonicola KI4]